MSYPGTDVLLLCYPINSPPSFENLAGRWIPGTLLVLLFYYFYFYFLLYLYFIYILFIFYLEIKHFIPDTPIILVGTKIDLREDEEAIERLADKKMKMVQYEDGTGKASEIGAWKYVECSALTQVGLKNVFDEVIRCALRGKKEFAAKQKRKRCIIA